MATGTKLLVVLGSGPGIGVGVASHFASQNFDRVALISRNADRLQSDVDAVTAAARESNRSDVTVKPYAVDVSDTPSLERVLRRVVEELGKPEVVVYNAAALRQGKFFETSDEDVNNDFKVGLCQKRAWSTPRRCLFPQIPN